MSIADLPHAILHEVSPNEIGFDQRATSDGTSTWDDPTKVRLGAYRPADGRQHFYLGVIGMDVLTAQQGATHRNERGFIAFKLDNTDGHPPLPCLEIYMQRTAESDADADMLCICRISSKGIELDPKGAGGMAINVPVTAAPSRVSRFYTDGGKFCVNMQDDQDNVRAVTYLIRPTQEYPNIVTTDESTWIAVGVAEL